MSSVGYISLEPGLKKNKFVYVRKLPVKIY